MAYHKAKRRVILHNAMKRHLNQRRAASRREPPCFLKMTTDYFVRLYHPRFPQHDSTPRVLVLCGRAPRPRPSLPTTHTTRPSEFIITVYFVRRRYAVPPPFSSLRSRHETGGLAPRPGSAAGNEAGPRPPRIGWGQAEQAVPHKHQPAPSPQKREIATAPPSRISCPF